VDVKSAEIVDHNHQYHQQQIDRFSPAVKKQACRQKHRIPESAGTAVVDQQNRRQKAKQENIARKQQTNTSFPKRERQPGDLPTRRFLFL
jgi:hypothetical protein